LLFYADGEKRYILAPVGLNVGDKVVAGAKVEVRITDRGPFIKGRIIDVSKAAAGHLGMIKSGVDNVCYRVVS